MTGSVSAAGGWRAVLCARRGRGLGDAVLRVAALPSAPRSAQCSGCPATDSLLLKETERPLPEAMCHRRLNSVSSGIFGFQFSPRRCRPPLLRGGRGYRAALRTIRPAPIGLFHTAIRAARLDKETPCEAGRSGELCEGVAGCAGYPCCAATWWFLEPTCGQAAVLNACTEQQKRRAPKAKEREAARKEQRSKQWHGSRVRGGRGMASTLRRLEHHLHAAAGRAAKAQHCAAAPVRLLLHRKRGLCGAATLRVCMKRCCQPLAQVLKG